KPYWVVVQDSIAMLDASRQKNEAAFLQLEGLVTAAKPDRAFEYVEHFVLRSVHVVRRLLPFLCYVFQHRRAATRPHLARFDSKVNAEPIRPSLARSKGIGTSPFVSFFHAFLPHNFRAPMACAVSAISQFSTNISPHLSTRRRSSADATG